MTNEGIPGPYYFAVPELFVVKSYLNHRQYYDHHSRFVGYEFQAVLAVGETRAPCHLLNRDVELFQA